VPCDAVLKQLDSDGKTLDDENYSREFEHDDVVVRPDAWIY
jgi:hypothetical protein